MEVLGEVEVEKGYNEDTKNKRYHLKNENVIIVIISFFETLKVFFGHCCITYARGMVQYSTG